MEKIIKLTPTELIAVVVPEDARNFTLYSDRNEVDRVFYELWYEHAITNISNKNKGVILGFQKFEILGTCDKDEITFNAQPWTNATGMMSDIAFKQLLRSHGIMFENPYGKKSPDKSYYRSTYDCAFHNYKWQEKYEIAALKYQTAQDSLVKKIVILKEILRTYNKRIIMTVQESVLHHKLDKRHKWFSFCGSLVRNENYTTPCSGCDGGGCHECGYTGKIRDGYPVPATDKEGNMIKVTDKDFTYFDKNINQQQPK